MAVAGLALMDGVEMSAEDARIPVTDPAVTSGWSVFETLLVTHGVAQGLPAHLARLARSAADCLVPMPDAELLAAEATRLAGAARVPSRLRITLTRGGRRVLTLLPLDPGRFHAGLRCARGPHRDEPFLGGRPKHAGRAAWAVAVARAGVDDVLLVDASGRFTEATTAAVVAVIGGELWTAPDDGRILPSTTLDDVLERAARLGIRVRREGPPAQGPWDGLYLASSTRDLAPVLELDGVALPGWEPVGRALADACGWFTAP